MSDAAEVPDGPDAHELGRAAERSGVVPLHPITPFESYLYRFVRAALLLFAKVVFRLRVDGVEHVPTDRPFILAPVHRSNIDFLVVLACGRRGRMRYLAKDTLWKPGWGRFFSALGGIPVARGTADREALRACVEVLGHGESLVMFPEGTRQAGPEVQPLFDGPAFVQSRTGAPIVPVGIGGSADAMPKGAKMIRPARIRIVVGEPMEAPAAFAAGGSGRARRSAVRDQTALLKVRVQELFDEAQRRVDKPNLH